jgi:hypothetical protein
MRPSTVSTDTVGEVGEFANWRVGTAFSSRVSTSLPRGETAGLGPQRAAPDQSAAALGAVRSDGTITQVHRIVSPASVYSPSQCQFLTLTLTADLISTDLLPFPQRWVPVLQ